jgi:predicted signal transduction protein with EAL and GGDEF domain
LQNFLREDDTAARFGGDEFAILLNSLSDQNQAVDVANRLIEVVADPFDYDGNEVSLSASVGIAFAAPSSDAEVMLRNADVAMYHAKRSGKGRVQIFSETMFRNAMERLEVKRDLVHVVEREELMLYFQPLVSLETGMPLGFEALLRWNHPVRGFVSPDAFIPLAEETGTIDKIGLWVLEEGIASLAAMDQSGNPGLTMSINVSPLQLETDSVLIQLAKSLAKHGIEPERIILELTETSALDKDTSQARLSSLAALGVGIAADDFGSGFASYASLQQLPSTPGKNDRSLNMGIAKRGSIG